MLGAVEVAFVGKRWDRPPVVWPLRPTSITKPLGDLAHALGTDKKYA